MKKNVLFISLSILLLALTGCASTTSSGKSSSAEGGKDTFISKLEKTEEMPSAIILPERPSVPSPPTFATTASSIKSLDNNPGSGLVLPVDLPFSPSPIVSPMPETVPAPVVVATPPAPSISHVTAKGLDVPVLESAKVPLLSPALIVLMVDILVLGIIITLRSVHYARFDKSLALAASLLVVALAFILTFIIYGFTVYSLGYLVLLVSYPIMRFGRDKVYNRRTPITKVFG